MPATVTKGMRFSIPLKYLRASSGSITLLVTPGLLSFTQSKALLQYPSLDIAAGSDRQMDAPAGSLSRFIKTRMGQGLCGKRQEVTHNYYLFLPNRIASVGQMSRQSPQLVQFGSPGLAPISQTLRHLSQSLHARVL